MADETSTPDVNESSPAPAVESNEDMISRIMDYDYFGGPEEEVAEEESPSDSLADVDVGEPAGEKKEGVAEAPPQPPKTPEAPKTNPELDELRRQLDELRETNKTLMGVVQSKAKEPEEKKEDSAPKPKAKYDEDIRYALAVPSDIAKLIYSEDPDERGQGLNGLVNGLAATIHTRLREEYQLALKDQISPVINSLPNVVGREVERSYSARQIVDDFYGTYKQVNLRQHGELVKTVAQAVFEQKGTESWNAEVRDEIGKRVYQILGLPLPSSEPSGKPTASAKPGPAKLTPTGNTRGAGRVLSQQEAEMMEFLKYE